MKHNATLDTLERISASNGESETYFTFTSIAQEIEQDADIAAMEERDELIISIRSLLADTLAKL